MDKLRRGLDVTRRSGMERMEYRRDDAVYAVVHNMKNRNGCVRDDGNACLGMERG